MAVYTDSATRHSTTSSAGATRWRSRLGWHNYISFAGNRLEVPEHWPYDACRPVVDSRQASGTALIQDGFLAGTRLDSRP